MIGVYRERILAQNFSSKIEDHGCKIKLHYLVRLTRITELMKLSATERSQEGVWMTRVASK